MKAKKKIGLSLMFTVLASQGLMAQSQLNITFNDGQKTQSIQLDKLESMKFDGNNLLLNEKAGSTKTFALSSLESITFGDEVTAIETINEKGNTVTQGFTIADISGRIISNNPAWKGGKVDTSSLPSGIYIIKTSTKTFKIKK